MYSLPVYDAADIALPPGGYMLPSPAAADLVYGTDAPGAATCTAEPIASTVFGVPVSGAAEGPVAPVAPDSHIGQAAGFISGAFGTPHTGFLLGAKSVAPIARFGAPFAFTFVPVVIHRICAARALHSTAFGKLSVRTAATGEASAAAPASLFGSGTARTTHHAQSVAPVALFGPARSGITAHPGGFHSTAFGAPCAGRVQPAGSVYREALWGAPSAAWYSAHSAAPASVGAQFGAHIASCAYRALHLAPATRFGKPLLLRSTTC